ncbi:MAG TPA: sugar phosphate isomerase/epimerase family protein [Chloroflexota bacterium]|nr:sugar phosphate isomerase/epimerase family protein [Chloroflexota bacterium]
MAENASPPFSVSEFTTMPWTFEQDLDHYRRLDVPALEVCEIKLSGPEYGAHLEQIDAAGLQISSVQPVVRTLYPSQSQPEPKDLTQRMERFRETIHRFGRWAHGVPFVTNTGIPPNGNMAETIRTAGTRYRELSEFAADHGATVALEPLNPSIQNIETAIWLLGQGMRIVEEVDRPNFGLCVDFWNVFQNPDVEGAIRGAGEKILIVQVSDWQTPRSYADRHIVGQGEIPFVPLLRATREAGYRGYYELEIFSDGVSDSLWSGDMEQVITESRQALNAFWAQALR